jgi:hypothetical protein
MRFVAQTALPSAAASRVIVARVLARIAKVRLLPHHFFHGQATLLVAKKGSEERRTGTKEHLGEACWDQGHVRDLGANGGAELCRREALLPRAASRT